MESDYLEKIINGQNGTAPMKVVFVDVQAYSKRRSQAQVSVVNAFMRCLKEALKATSQHFIEYSQKNNINFKTDIISLPSGDGAAIVFPFDGVHDIHLYFAIQLLSEVKKNNDIARCEKFEENGWCNCHDAFNLCIGVSEGKGIIYKDLNDSYNVAGNTINIAARTMDKAEANQIFFSEDAYRILIDMIDDPNFDEYFREYTDITIKHGISINIYQYIGEGDGVNHSPAEELILMQKARGIINKISNMEMPFINLKTQEVDKKKLVAMLENIAQYLLPESHAIEIPPIDIEQKSVPTE